jgi:hypothetical protein
MISGPQQLQLFSTAEVIPRGDGTFLLRPGKPSFGREKVSISEAVRRFGSSESTWLRLFECRMIEGERPSPRKTFLYVDSIAEHLRKSSDPEFWTEARRKAFVGAI